MSHRTWVRRAGALAALVLGVGVLWYVRGDVPLEPPPPTPAEAPAPPAEGRPEAGAAPAQVAGPEREPAPPDRTAADTQPVRAAQGFRGLAVDEHNRPLAAIQVYLLESASNDPLALPLVLQQGLAMGPLAATQSAADGTFEVGLPVATEKLYELRLLSANHADARIGGLRVLEGQWHEVGSIVMVPGATVRGRVTVEGTELPVPQAVVTLEAGTAFEDAAQRSLPGRERGLTAAVDQNGLYELRNAPARGVVQVSAVAPGFARIVRQNLELTSGRSVEVNFGLPPGLTLAGQVVDPAGKPIARARIEAWPMQAAGAALVAQSRMDGRFDVLGLTTGLHRLRVMARGFQDLDQPDVVPGRTDLQVVLQPRSTVQVRVVTPDRQVVRRYMLGVRRYFAEPTDRPGAGHIGLLVEVPDQRVRLDGLTDAVEVAGIPAGTFVCQVEADGFAKTLSDPFTADASGQALAVEVVLSDGATLRGRVVDDRGQPLAGATVETQADGANPDNPVWRMLANAAPDKISPARATTGADGSFVLPRLALARYQLQVDHLDACRTIVRGLDLGVAGETTLPPIRLARGALVHGKATVGGKITGQVKVVLTSAAAAGTAPVDAVRIETVTDSSGVFRMARRVPPGAYELRAAAVGTTEPEAQIFRQLLQLQRSSTTFTVAHGQTEVERHIDLPTDH